MNANDTYRPASKEEINALQLRAAKAGDMETVRLCDEALMAFPGQRAAMRKVRAILDAKGAK